MRDMRVHEELLDQDNAQRTEAALRRRGLTHLVDAARYMLGDPVAAKPDENIGTFGVHSRPSKLTPEEVDELLERGKRGVAELRRQLSGCFGLPRISPRLR